MARRRFAHGSSTGVQQLQIAASRTLDACAQVQRAAQLVTQRLDELSVPPATEDLDDGRSVIAAIERAQRRCTPS